MSFLRYAEDVGEVHVGCLEPSNDNSVYSHNQTQASEPQHTYISNVFTISLLSNILLSRLIPYAEEVIGDHQCGFRRNRWTTGHIFCIRQILEKKNGNAIKQCISSL
jgi:hypothetical protein